MSTLKGTNQGYTKNQFNEGFVTVSKSYTRIIDKCTSLDQIKIFTYMLTNANEWGVCYLKQVEIAFHYKMKKQQVWRAIQTLKKLGLIKKKIGKFYVNPNYIWCGKNIHHRDAIERWSKL